MPYQINRHAHNMLWVTIQGYMPMEHVENYFQEMWRTLDDCPHPTDILVDGRLMQNSSNVARQRTEQVAHHPHLGHVAFVVDAQHLLIFAPLVHLISGIGLFGDEHTAMDYLNHARGTPRIASNKLPTVSSYSEESQRIPPPPPQHGGFAGLLDSLSSGLRQISRSVDQE
ncbi:MAG: hypothetical protein WCJ55_10680 [Chloroflexales bacterium]